MTHILNKLDEFFILTIDTMGFWQKKSFFW